MGINNVHKFLSDYLVHLWCELTGYMCGLERICTYQKKTNGGTLP